MASAHSRQTTCPVGRPAVSVTWVSGGSQAFRQTTQSWACMSDHQGGGQSARRVPDRDLRSYAGRLTTQPPTPRVRHPVRVIPFRSGVERYGGSRRQARSRLLSKTWAKPGRSAGNRPGRPGRLPGTRYPVWRRARPRPKSGLGFGGSTAPVLTSRLALERLQPGALGAEAGDPLQGGDPRHVRVVALDVVFLQQCRHLGDHLVDRAARLPGRHEQGVPLFGRLAPLLAGESNIVRHCVARWSSFRTGRRGECPARRPSRYLDTRSYRAGRRRTSGKPRPGPPARRRVVPAVPAGAAVTASGRP